MSLPGFTAGFSLNESREYYVMMQKDVITRGGAVVVPQQIDMAQRDLFKKELPPNIVIECPECVWPWQRQVCEVRRGICSSLSEAMGTCERELVGYIRPPCGPLKPCKFPIF